MNKKRREFTNCKTLTIPSENDTIMDLIANKTVSHEDKGVTLNKYNILPTFGQGSITNYDIDSIEITISRFKLNKDLVIFNKGNTDFIQLSFLLDGQKIISLEETNSDILYESQESYLVNINSFNGYSRISSEKLFKEIKIKISKPFILIHGFTNRFTFKKITDKKTIIPITNKVLNILSELEDNKLTGISQNIYLKAKTFELIALQLENYKNQIFNNLLVNKTLKILYSVKQKILENLDQNISIHNLSKEVLINEAELQKQFKQVFGCSINKYAIDKKMEKAKMLLLNTQLPIYQISEDIGYKNATHFSAAFKKYFGQSPKQLRNLV
jgi:AraC-like DNA-binding protein